MSLLVCDNAKKANMLIQAADDWPKLRQLVVMNGLDDVNQELAARKNIKLSSFAEAIVSICITVCSRGSLRGQVVKATNL